MPTKTANVVRDLMTKEVTTLDRNEKLSIADRTMNLGRVRHMPVVDEDGTLVGVVSQRDLFRGALATALGYGTVAQAKMLESLYAKEVMSTDVVTISPDAPLAQAAQMMIERKIGCLPVVENGTLIGILTESDLLKLIADHR